MNKQEKIEYLNKNTHHLVFDYEADGETCAEVLVPLTKEVEKTLLELGVEEKWIVTNKIQQHDGDYAIDLTYAGFTKCKAVWWHPDHGFMTYRFE